MPVEEILSRELREVADGLPVPALPHFRRSRPALGAAGPLLVAAAAVLIVAGGVAVAVLYRDDGGLSPTPDPVETLTVRPLTTEAPTVPYVFGDELYVDGQQVPGSWWEVGHAGAARVAERNDLTMHWGTDAEPHVFPGELILKPQLSPDGTWLAVSTTADGGQVLLIDTHSGETVNALPTDADGARGANDIGVVAVTDDAKVLLDSDAGQLMWLAADGDDTVELAPGQFPWDATPAGLIVLDSTRDDEAYLADVADSGQLTRLRTLPLLEIVINPSGTWLAYGGSWGGESQTIPEITAQPLDGGRQLTPSAARQAGAPRDDLGRRRPAARRVVRRRRPDRARALQHPRGTLRGDRPAMSVGAPDPCRAPTEPIDDV